MDFTNSHHAQTHVLPGNLGDVASEKKHRFYQSSDKKCHLLVDTEEVPAHAFDENDGIPLSSKETKLVWLAIVVGQLILALTIYAIL
ncbi:hypothetical protein [Arcticibacter sp.]|uniref:hypothetical protein n=1 Tax=Arcticibacter sp. TaxID=1872630 RepID=UPI00388D14C6